LRDQPISGREYADILEKNSITVNKNSVPNDTRNFIETSGIRIGVAAETTRGHDQQWFQSLAKKMISILQNHENCIS
jgi:glycine hydroxymethyltransferase